MKVDRFFVKIRWRSFLILLQQLLNLHIHNQPEPKALKKVEQHLVGVSVYFSGSTLEESTGKQFYHTPSRTKVTYGG